MQRITTTIKHHQFSFWFMLTLLLTVLCFCVGYRVWKYDYFHYPMVYRHDGFEFLKVVKNIVDTGGHWTGNSSLGAPFISNLYVDFPQADGLAVVAIKLLAILLGGQVFLIGNVFVFLGYVAVAVSTFVVLYKLELKPWLAMGGALLYAFLPYHFIRVSAGHLYLAFYFTVPLACYLSLKLTEQSFHLQEYRSVKRWMPVVLTTLLIASIGSGYYALFSVCVIFLGGLIGWRWFRNYQSLVGALLISAIIGAGLIVNLAPALIYQYQHGSNHLIDRNPAQIEEFGLRLSRLLVPLPNTIFPFIRNFLTTYYAGVQHEQYQYLGLFGVIGLIYLLSIALMSTKRDLDKTAALIAVGLLLFGMSGGIAYLTGSLFGAQIRAFNRLSVFLAFYAIVALLRLLQRTAIERSRIVALVMILALAGCLFEQFSVIDPHRFFWATKDRFASDRKVVQQIEATLPPGSMVYQLPYLSYPESGAECSLDSYDLFAGYLHSQRLKWSFGAVKGRPDALWQQHISQLPVRALIDNIVLAGFDGLYLDRSGCLNFWDLKDAIEKQVGSVGMVSDDQRVFFYDLRTYAAVLKAGLSPAEWQQGQSGALDPVYITFPTTLGRPAFAAGSLQYEIKKNAVLTLMNSRNQPRNVTVKATLSVDSLKNYPVRAKYLNHDRIIILSATPYQLSDKISIPPGKSAFELIGEDGGQPFILTNFQIIEN